MCLQGQPCITLAAGSNSSGVMFESIYCHSCLVLALTRMPPRLLLYQFHRWPMKFISWQVRNDPGYNSILGCVMSHWEHPCPSERVLLACAHSTRTHSGLCMNPTLKWNHSIASVRPQRGRAIWKSYPLLQWGTTSKGRRSLTQAWTSITRNFCRLRILLWVIRGISCQANNSEHTESTQWLSTQNPFPSSWCLHSFRFHSWVNLSAR